MSTLLAVLRGLAGITKILELVRYLREAWLKNQNAREENAKNDRNDSAIDALGRVSDGASQGRDSTASSRSSGGGNGTPTP